MRRQARPISAFAEGALILLIASAVMGCAPAEESLARYSLGEEIPSWHYRPVSDPMAGGAPNELPARVSPSRRKARSR